MTGNSELTVKPRGFQIHPELINRNGAPKKGTSITELVQKLLRKKPQGQKLTYREMFAMKVLKLALEGDITAIKTIWSYMDGAPSGSVPIIGVDNKVQIVIVNTCPKCGANLEE